MCVTGHMLTWAVCRLPGQYACYGPFENPVRISPRRAGALRFRAGPGGCLNPPLF